VLAVRLPVVDLPSEAVVLVLTCELDVFEPLEYDLNAFGRLGEHGLERDADPHVASLLDLVVLVTYFEQSLHDEPIVGELAGCLFDCEFELCDKLVEHSLAQLLFLVDGRFVGWRVSDGTSECRYHSFFCCSSFETFLKPASDVLCVKVVSVLQNFAHYVLLDLLRVVARSVAEFLESLPDLCEGDVGFFGSRGCLEE